MTDPSEQRASEAAELRAAMKENLANLGARLAAAAATPDDLDCLEVFASRVAVESDGLRPHLLMVVLEPEGSVRALAVGHVNPGFTVQVDDELDFDILQMWFAEDRLPRPEASAAPRETSDARDGASE